MAEIKPRVKDRYGRTVAWVTCDGIDANAEQVNRGMAWVYRRYARDHNLYILQHKARRYKRGLWADEFPTAPWEWRKSTRHAAAHLISYA